MCACGEGSCETEGKEERKQRMQGRKRRLEKTSLPHSLLWAGGGNYGQPKIVVFFPPQLEEGPADTGVALNPVSGHTF